MIIEGLLIGVLLFCVLCVVSNVLLRSLCRRRWASMSQEVIDRRCAKIRKNPSAYRRQLRRTRLLADVSAVLYALIGIAFPFLIGSTFLY